MHFSRISQNFWKILEKFHFLISILRHFQFTFYSRSRFWDIFISLFTLDLDIKAFSFHFSFSKWVNQIFISLFTSRTSNIHSRRTLPCWPSPLSFPWIFILKQALIIIRYAQQPCITKSFSWHIHKTGIYLWASFLKSWSWDWKGQCLMMIFGLSCA